LQETGGALEFSVEPDTGTWFHVVSFQTVFVDAVTADNADSTMPQLSYNKILDMTPTAGYVYRRYTGGDDEPTSEFRITSLMDLLSFPQSKLSNYVSDGTNTMITVTDHYTPPVKFTLKSEDLDRITMDVEDNFSQLLFFRISVTGYVEQRQ